MNGAPRSSSDGLDLLLGVPLHVSAELGKCKLSMGEILKLGTGSLLQLDRAADAPVDVLVNGKLVARGEIVSVDEHFGIRVSELVREGGSP